MAEKRKAATKSGKRRPTGAAARSLAASKAAQAETREAKQEKGRKGGLKAAANARKRSAAARKAAATRSEPAVPQVVQDVGGGALIGASVGAVAGALKNLLTGNGHRGKSKDKGKR